MKNLLILLITIKFSFMYTQQSAGTNFEVINFDETLKYDIANMEEFKYSPYNASTAFFIDDDKILITPNLHDGRCLITSKAVSEEMFTNNSFPLLPENNTAYFHYKIWMNKEDFKTENMITILSELGLTYNKNNFYYDTEKIAKSLSAEDKKKLLIPMLYFIGEDLKNLCPEAEWIFNTKYYFQPFAEPTLSYEEHFYSFYDLNILLDQKLNEGKNITFKKIYEKVESYYLKKKELWRNK